MVDLNSLEKSVREAGRLYGNISFAGRVYHNPVARRAAVLGVSIGVATAGVYLFSSSEVTGDAAKTYGFLEGITDGLYSPVNAVISCFKDVTIASDNSGITSQPAGSYYPLGFGTSVVLLWGILIKTALSKARSSMKSKR